MQYRKLGKSDIKVSALCLGTMTWGEQNTEQEAHEQLDYAFERGINFIDTAEMYPVPPMQKTYTKTEQFIGRWKKLKSQRDKVILATKIAGTGEMVNYVRSGKNKFNRENLESAVNESLKRLSVEMIDLYQLHWPERQTNFFGQLGYNHRADSGETPLEETLEVLNDIAQTGKVRCFGLSNETPWGTSTFLKLAEQKNWPRMVSVQNPYNLLNRTYEVGMAEISIREECGLLAYSPLAFGALSGKYLGGKKPSGARLTLWDRFSRYTSPKGIQATEAYTQLAQRFGLSPVHLALSFVTSRPFVTSNIIGATKMDQLKENIDSIDVELNGEILEAIESIHNEIPNPCP